MIKVLREFCPFYDEYYDDWEYLIILDACRYDFFKIFHKHFLKGRLAKALSIASNTYEYCVKCLMSKPHPDVVYISANPYINSKFKIGRSDTRKLFYRIIDVWLQGWNNDLGTVLPEKMNRITLSIIKKLDLEV